MKLIRRQLLQLAGAAVAGLGVSASSWGAEPNVVELATGKKSELLRTSAAGGARRTMLGGHMRHLLFAVAFAASLGSIECATAQDAGDGPTVPTAKAPFHLPAFQNDYVTLLNVYIPPGRNTGFHAHTLDIVTVVVEDTDYTAQNLGRQPNPVTHQPRGNVVFAESSKQAQTHKVTNVGATPFHIVAFEFIKPQPGRFMLSSRADVPGYALVMDNERVRAWRLVLEPGQSVAAVTQQAPGIRVVVDGGELVEIAPGQPERGMALKLGDFFWQEPGVTRAVRNTGTSRVELVEFELK